MNKHYAIADLHGMYSLWQQIRDYCDETDVIYFLGDACDRGPDGIKIIQELLIDDRVIYLKGNHEEFITQSVKGNYALWYQNGGDRTIADFRVLSQEKRIALINELNKLPEEMTYINTKGQKIIMTHSGYYPFDQEETKYMEYNLFLWDRLHIYTSWYGKKNEFIVHGHTGVKYLLSALNLALEFCDKPKLEAPTDEILNYCDGHKFCLDLTSAATNKIALFDLDELKVEKYFTIGEK